LLEEINAIAFSAIPNPASFSWKTWHSNYIGIMGRSRKSTQHILQQQESYEEGENDFCFSEWLKIMSAYPVRIFDYADLAVLVQSWASWDQTERSSKPQNRFLLQARQETWG
jgi:hypothetical protein